MKKERISTLALETTQTLYVDPTFKDVVKIKLARAKSKFSKLLKFNRNSFKRAWIAVSYASFSFLALVLIFYPMKVTPNVNHKYSIYSATPLQLGSVDYSVYARDARAQKINAVFKKYHCPLEGMGEAFVYEADNNNIPWWIVAAISFKESSCGKLTPEPNGLESYNAWGWGVYGTRVESFDNWSSGINAVSTYLSERFFSRGVSDPCEIMKIYTPPSNGSWCTDVKYFGDEIVNYQTPNK